MTILLNCSSINTVFADDLPKTLAVPGGVEIVQIHTSSPIPPKAYFQGHRLLILKGQADLWYALVGIPLDIAPKTYSIQIQLEGRQVINETFTLHSIIYPTEYLENKNSNTEDKPNHSSALNEVLSTWTDSKPQTLHLQLPIKGKIFGAFGLQRFYNEQPRPVHNGVDIAAPLNAPVYCPLQGEVLAVGNYANMGNVVVLNHGGGFLTLYAHLNKISVSKGQHVAAEEVIGTVGQGGIITQPHLHWSVILNGAFVNPELFLETSPQTNS